MAHHPTPETRREVEELRACGATQPFIARRLGITEPTLKKHYEEELRFGLESANCAVGKTLFDMAISGECPSATFFWLKTRGGWREAKEPLNDSEVEAIDIADALVKIEESNG